MAAPKDGATIRAEAAIKKGNPLTGESNLAPAASQSLSELWSLELKTFESNNIDVTFSTLKIF